MPLFAWSVFIVGYEQHATTVNAPTAGKAKRQFQLDLDGCYPDLKFKQLRVHKLGQPRTSRAQHHKFLRVAEMRGVPTWRIGDAVICHGKHRGQLFRSNSSANFDVLFDDADPGLGGRIYNVHPLDIENVTDAERKMGAAASTTPP